MSFTIRLRARDGTITAGDTEGDVPDGIFTIEGADDGNRIRLAVHQHDTAGRFVTAAAHVRDRAETALHEAEAAAEAITEAGGEAVTGVAVAGEAIAVTRE